MTEKLNFDLDPLLIRIAIGLSVLGAIVSFFSALVAGASLFGILIQPVIMALLMAVMGAVVFYLLQFMYPEILDQMRKAFLNSGLDLDDEGGLDDMNLGDDMGDLDAQADQGSGSGSELQDDSALVAAGGGKKPQKAKADEILVEGVAIKNEPKLMAEAIQHLLDQDED